MQAGAVLQRHTLRSGQILKAKLLPIPAFSLALFLASKPRNPRVACFCRNPPRLTIHAGYHARRRVSALLNADPTR